MDKKSLMALLAVAMGPVGSDVMAQQISQAIATGDFRYVSRETFLRAIYNVSTLPEGEGISNAVLVQRGYNAGEASQITKIIRSIAHKAGSEQAFFAVLEGRQPKGVQLTARETVLLRSVVANPGGRTGPLATKLDGRTWEGHGGDTWKGSHLSANLSLNTGVTPGPLALHTKLDGRTWEGTGGDTWVGHSSSIVSLPNTGAVPAPSALHTKLDGRTWEGTGGDTWVGHSSSMVANPQVGVSPAPVALHTKLDGRTWEGTGGDTWVGHSSSMVANPQVGVSPAPVALHKKLDGHTWEGTSGNTWEGSSSR